MILFAALPASFRPLPPPRWPPWPRPAMPPRAYAAAIAGGRFGGEIAAPVENPGFFGTAVLSHTRIGRVVDDQGNDIAVPAAPCRCPPAHTHRRRGAQRHLPLLVPAGSIGFEQTQTQLNLLGGCVSEGFSAGGRLAFVVNLPLIRQSRDFEPSQPRGTVSPTPGPPCRWPCAAPSRR